MLSELLKEVDYAHEYQITEKWLERTSVAGTKMDNDLSSVLRQRMHGTKNNVAKSYAEIPPITTVGRMCDE
jgi:hypothetical protein